MPYLQLAKIVLGRRILGSSTFSLSRRISVDIASRKSIMRLLRC